MTAAETNRVEQAEAASGLETHDEVLRDDAHGAVYLTLNRPDKRNALDVATFIALEAHLSAMLDTLDDVGAVVIRGAGQCFSAGADISGPTRAPRRNFQASVIEQLANFPRPVLAVVHGHCLTGGLELALAADLIVAAESARFADTHAQFGLAATWGLTQRLPRRIGAYRTRELMFTGRVVTGREAAEIGLATRYAPDAELQSVTAELVATIVGGSWFSHGQHKKALLRTDGMALAAGLADESLRIQRVAPDFADRGGARFVR
jgi:enoyl-CoA hydratase/carnithine racemase